MNITRYGRLTRWCLACGCAVALSAVANEPAQTDNLDPSKADDIAQKMEQTNGSLESAIGRAQSRTDGVTIKAQAFFLSEEELKQAKQGTSAADRGERDQRTERGEAGYGREERTTDRGREDAERPGAERTAQAGAAGRTLAVEIVSVSDRDVEIVTVLPETGEILKSKSMSLDKSSRPTAGQGFTDRGERRKQDGSREERQQPDKDLQDRDRRERMTEARDMDRNRANDLEGQPVKQPRGGATIAKADNVIGAQIKNAKGEELGEIENLAIDENTGRVAYAVVAYGGFLGMGEKLFAVPWQALRPEQEGTFILDVEEQELENAPGFDRKNWPDMANSQWGEEVHTFYDVEPYWQQSEEVVVSEREGDDAGRGMQQQTAKRQQLHSEAQDVAKLLKDSKADLKKAVSKAEQHTNGKAITATAKLASTSEMKRLQDESRERTGRTAQGGTGEGADRPGMELRRTSDRERPEEARRARGATDDAGVIIEVACLTEKDGSRTLKMVLVNADTGEVVGERDVNHISLDRVSYQSSGAR